MKVIDIIRSKYGEVEQNRDAYFISNLQWVLKRVSKTLVFKTEKIGFARYSPLWSGCSSGLPDEILDLSDTMTYLAGKMLALGIHFLGDQLFPKPAFESIGGKTFLRTTFIQGDTLDSVDIDELPRQFIRNLAQLTVLMALLFRNADMYLDNLILRPNKSICAIDLTECGKKKYEHAHYALWYFRVFNFNDFTAYAPSSLFKKIKVYEEQYRTDVLETVGLILRGMANDADIQRINSFDSEHKWFYPTGEHKEQTSLLKMEWYKESRQAFLELTRDSLSRSPYLSDRILYSELINEGIRALLSLPRIEKDIESDEFDIEDQRKEVITYSFNLKDYIPWSITNIDPFDMERCHSDPVDSIQFIERSTRIKEVTIHSAGRVYKIIQPSPDSLTDKLFDSLSRHLGINREFYLLTDREKKAESFWDLNWRGIIQDSDDYDYIHTMMCYQLEQIAKALYSGGRQKLTILDLACGKDPFWKILLERKILFKLGFSEISFIMVDLSKISIDHCQSQERELKIQGVELPKSLKTTYFCANAENFNIWDYDIDIIMSSGGLTRAQVASNRAQAIKYLEHCVMSMNPGSYYIDGGLSFSYIGSNTAKKLGLIVVEANDKWSGLVDRYTPLYVFKKPEYSSSLQEKIYRLIRSKNNQGLSAAIDEMESVSTLSNGINILVKAMDAKLAPPLFRKLAGKLTSKDKPSTFSQCQQTALIYALKHARANSAPAHTPLSKDLFTDYAEILLEIDDWGSDLTMALDLACRHGMGKIAALLFKKGAISPQSPSPLVNQGGRPGDVATLKFTMSGLALFQGGQAGQHSGVVSCSLSSAASSSAMELG